MNGTDLAILRRPRQVHTQYEAERARRRPRRAREESLWKEYCEASRRAAAESYSREFCSIRAGSQVLPYALSVDEDRGRTPYFYRRQAIIWAREARSPRPLMDRAACVRLAKSYLEGYRARLRKWSREVAA